MKVNFQKVEPVSKKHHVARLLKDAIISGGISAGEQIVEARMAQQFGVGQGLIREALIELECQGFVQRTPFSNTRVLTLSEQDAQQIFDVRIELEPLAFELAGRNLRPRDVGDLRKSIAQSEEGASAGKFADFFNGHLAFSRRVWALSENRYLREALERLVVPLFALYLPRVSFKCDGLMQKALRCSGRQQQILEAMQTGDVREIKRMVSDCLIQMKRIISQL